MALNPETLILDKEKLIESIWQYRKYILEYRVGFAITVMVQRQYKETRGKHIEVAPRDIIKAKKKGLSDWFNVKRGYKGIYKWHITDYEDVWSNTPRQPDYFNITMGEGGSELKDYQNLLALNYNHLIGLNFAFITYLSRKQPLTKSTESQRFSINDLVEELQFHFLEPLEEITIGSIRNRLRKWVREDKISSEQGFMCFGAIYVNREIEYIKDIADWLKLKAEKSRSKEKRAYWLNEYNKIGDPANRGATALEEVGAEEGLITGRIKKYRSKYIQRLKLDTTDISYPT